MSPLGPATQLGALGGHGFYWVFHPDLKQRPEFTRARAKQIAIERDIEIQCIERERARERERERKSESERERKRKREQDRERKRKGIRKRDRETERQAERSRSVRGDSSLRAAAAERTGTLFSPRGVRFLISEVPLQIILCSHEPASLHTTATPPFRRHIDTGVPHLQENTNL